MAGGFKVVFGPPARLAPGLTKRLATKYEKVLQTKTGPLAVELAQKYAADAFINDRPPHRRRSTRHYSNAFFFKVVPGRGVGGLPLMQFGNRAQHAKILENGSKPHVIRARNTKYLKFRFGTLHASAYDVGGMRFRGRQVRHPGTKGKHISRRAVTTATRQTFKP